MKLVASPKFIKNIQLLRKLSNLIRIEKFDLAHFLSCYFRVIDHQFTYMDPG